MDLAAAIIILAFSAVVLGWVIPNFISTKYDAGGDLPPALISSLSMGVCALTALLIGISAWRRKDDKYSDIPKSVAGETLSFGLREVGALLLWSAAFGIIWLLLKFVGFEVAAGVVIAGGAVYGGVRNPIVVILVALIIPQIIDKATWYGLQIKLP
jgi:hypothetical protein